MDLSRPVDDSLTNYRRSLVEDAGYIPTKSDPCLYRRIHNGKETLVSVVVDDLLISFDNNSDAKRDIKKLKKVGLDTNDLGVPSYVIGTHIKKHKNGDISLNQRLHIEALLLTISHGGLQFMRTISKPNRAT